MLRLIPNNPVTVFKQVLSRLVVIYMIMPLIWSQSENEWAVMLAAIPWCIAESVRYPYY